jgi:hypothetical protein
MKVSALALVALSTTTKTTTTTMVGAWSSSPSSSRQHDAKAVPTTTTTSRRQVLGQSLAFLAATATTLVGAPPAAQAGSLLDEFGADPTSRTFYEPTATASAAQPVVPKDPSLIEPNLRSNYYYPTNKKRYLPRIKKCSDAIPEAAAAIGNADWAAVSDFCNKIADDTVLPMRLYTSSLSGGGTNVKVSFATDMNKCADDFAKSQTKLVAALKRQDQTASSAALEGMAVALQRYRTVGRLLGPDGGGDIPSGTCFVPYSPPLACSELQTDLLTHSAFLVATYSSDLHTCCLATLVDDIRRSACRVQGRTFTQKVNARDERLKSAMVGDSLD